MPFLASLDAARLATLATGRGGFPSAQEWPLVALALALAAVVGTRLLLAVGLTKVESFLLAGVAPALVVVDAPLGSLSSNVALAANVTGCLIPVAVALKVAIEGRVGRAELFLLVVVATLVSYLSSHVVPGRGVLLQYRIPAAAVGVLAAAFFHTRPASAGAAGFAAGGMGVLLGADVLRLGQLAQMDGMGRVILGGAGLLDGIFLVAILSAAIAASVAVLLRAVLPQRQKSRAAV